MPRIAFTVHGKAAPKSVRFSKHGTYNSKRVRAWMRTVMEHALPYRSDGAPAGIPVAVMLDFFLPWPKATRKKVATTEQLHTKKPDIDNLIKPVLDGLTEAGLWEDDNQIAQLFGEKRQCPRGEERVEIVLKW